MGRKAPKPKDRQVLVLVCWVDVSMWKPQDLAESLHDNHRILYNYIMQISCSYSDPDLDPRPWFLGG